MDYLLPALTTHDLGIDLIGTRVQQLDGAILQLPHITVEAEIRVIGTYSLAGDHLRGFNSYGLGLCYHRRLSRAGRQEEAEQPNHEQPGCCA